MKKFLLIALVAMLWSVPAWSNGDDKLVIKKVGDKYIMEYEEADNIALLRARSTGEKAEKDNLIRVTKRIADKKAPGGFRIEETFEESQPIAVRQSTGKKAPTTDGDEFTALTPEGVEMKFKVISAAAKTCQVGFCPEQPSSWSSSWACIDNNYSGSVTIPAEVEGYTVTKISGAAFYYCKKLTGVTIPETVVSIDGHVFAYCENLASLYIPMSVLDIKYNSLASAKGRSTIVVDKNNPVYDSRDNCNAVIKTATNTLIGGCKNTVIPSSVTTIETLAFYSCDDLSSIHIPANVTKIGSQSFDYCPAIEQITVATDNPNYDSRNNCNAIIKTKNNQLVWGSNNTVILPEIVSIGSHAFRSRRITEVTLPTGLQNIGYSAFEGTQLQSITIPSTVQSLEEEALSIWNMTDVTSLILEPMDIPESTFSQNTYNNGVLHVPDGTKGLYKNKIGWRNFQNIDGTGDDTPVELKDGDTFVETISNDVQMTFTVLSIADKTCAVGKPYNASGDRSAVVWNTYGDIIIPETINGFTVRELNARAFQGCNYITAVEIPKTVVSIDDFAFSGCRSLKSLYIPASVINLSNYALANADGRIEIVVDKANPVYDSRENCNAVINTSTNELVAGCKTTVIPASVTKLGHAAFYGCNELKDFIIPKGIIAFGSQALSYCSNLNSLSVEDGNTVYDSRDNCNAIIETATDKLVWASNRTVIPKSIKIMGEDAFTFRTQRTIYIPEGATTLESWALSGCSNLSVVTIPSTVTSIGNYAFSSCSKLAVITCSITNPFEVNENIFHSNVYTNGKLNIPATTLGLYQAQAAWNKFTNIVERKEVVETGDASGDGVVDVGDVEVLMELLTGTPPVNLDPLAADTNSDGKVDVSDIIRLINILLGK